MKRMSMLVATSSVANELEQNLARYKEESEKVLWSLYLKYRPDP